MKRYIALALVLMSGGCKDDYIKSRSVALKPDYPAATYQQAYAYTAGRQAPLAFQPSFIVIHTAEGTYAGTISWFKNPSSGVSSHYVVSKNGDVTQMVEEKDTAYHIGAAMSVTSVGIEHEGYVADPAKWYTDTMYSGSAALVKNIAERWGIPLDRCHILGHDEVPDPKNPCVYGGAEHHTDPGSGWNWTKYMGMVGGSSTKCSYSCTSKQGSLAGVVRNGSLLPTAPPVVGAKVSIASASTTTDKNGFYRFDNLDIGYYFPTTVSAPGFKNATQNQAVVIPLDNYSNFALTPGVSPDGGGPGKEAGTTPPKKDGGPASQSDLKAAPSSDGGLTPAPEPDAEESLNPEPSGSGGGCSVDQSAWSASGGASVALLLVFPLLGLVAVRVGRRHRSSKR